MQRIWAISVCLRSDGCCCTGSAQGALPGKEAACRKAIPFVHDQLQHDCQADGVLDHLIDVPSIPKFQYASHEEIFKEIDRKVQADRDEGILWAAQSVTLPTSFRNAQLETVEK